MGFTPVDEVPCKRCLFREDCPSLETEIPCPGLESYIETLPRSGTVH
jgi:hypothetical protein